MTFGEFLHLITTSRYTRRLERENEELRAEVKHLREVIETARHRPVAVIGTKGENAESSAVATPAGRRRSRWVGFSQRKRELESLEAPPKGA